MRYFETKEFNLEAYWNAISSGKMRFAIYVYIKAFREFYVNENNRELFKNILKNVKAIDEKYKKEHPWQLIYMNLHEIAKAYHAAPEELQELRQNAYKCVTEKSFTIDMLLLHFELQCMEDNQEIRDWDEKTADWLQEIDSAWTGIPAARIIKKYFIHKENISDVPALETSASDTMSRYLNVTGETSLRKLKETLDDVCTYEYC